jgi:Family of unknown function (DUF6186)
MNSRSVVITGFVVLGCAGLLLLAAGRLGVLARPGEIVDALLAPRRARIVVVLVWVWLGWHVLVRTG